MTGTGVPRHGPRRAVIVAFTTSVALLGDTIHNFADALTALPAGKSIKPASSDGPRELAESPNVETMARSAPGAADGAAPPAATSYATLTRALRAFGDDELAELFRVRSDLVTPLPSDLNRLASRATSHTSLVRVLDRLDRRELAALEALVVAGARVSYARLAELLPLSAAELREVVNRLRRLAVLWGPDEALRIPGLLNELLGPYPAGLGPVTESPSNDQIAALLDQAGPQARAAAELLAGGSPAGRIERAQRDVTVASARTPVEHLLARGLLQVVDATTVVLPRQVGLFLRGGRLFDKADLEPPAVTGQTREGGLVEQSAAGTALEFVRRMERLLDDFGRNGPPALRAGGLGVRELRRVAARAGVDETVAALYLEVAYVSGLLESSEVWLPTTAYDRWLALPVAERWSRLAAAWLDSPRSAGLAGTRDERDRLRSVLSDELSRPAAPEYRRLALRIVGEAGAGVSPTSEVVLDRLRWLRPRRTGPGLSSLVESALTEAAEIGVTGLGALPRTGRALLDQADVAAELAPLLPEPVDHILLQADLTAVAPGPLTRELAASLSRMADAESHGGATVYRFGPASIRRALDAGADAAELHRLLQGASTTPVPQPLSYLIDDVARRHGRLRAGTATAYLRCDDEAMLDALLADRQTRSLGLHRIAPTVVISRQPVRALVDELRALGYEPVAESDDGGILVDTPRSSRAGDAGRQPIGFGPGEPDPELLRAAVRAVRAGDRAVREGDRARAGRPDRPATGRLPRTVSTTTIEILRGAAAAGRSVWLGYADQHGGISDRIVDPVRLDDGRLVAYDHAAGESRTFALHRISGAAPVDEAC